MLAAWILATRPKTLAAGVVPVLVGFSLALSIGPNVAVEWWTGLGCLVGALLIQIGTNFANDAFDALTGADAPDRLGPTRAVASGLISARAMLIATAITLALALAVGLWLSVHGGWPILVLGVISLVCAVAYTGGPFPLAYHGLGDLFVFLFFGLFAVLGTAWVQVAKVVNPGLEATAHLTFAIGRTPISTSADRWILRLPPEWWLIAAAVGLQATAIIAVNNQRDIATDARVGKRTLAVRLGERGARIYYGLLHVAAAACWWSAAVWLHDLRLGVPAAIATVGGAAVTYGVARSSGAALNAYLARSAALELITGLSAAVMLGMVKRLP
jgi:1,4-dihydroxy-2-naphthoate octaprenyltransferase